jgi:hypothetical protein
LSLLQRSPEDGPVPCGAWDFPGFLAENTSGCWLGSRVGWFDHVFSQILHLSNRLIFMSSFAEALIEVIAEPKISVVTALLPPRGPGQICRMHQVQCWVVWKVSRSRWSHSLLFSLSCVTQRERGHTSKLSCDLALRECEKGVRFDVHCKAKSMLGQVHACV